MDTEAAAVKAWMRHVMEERGWSAEEWARKASTSPTNITRFLKEAKHVPSTRTLAKLSRIAGSAPPIGRPLVSIATTAIPFYNRPPGVPTAEKPQTIGSIEVMGAVSDRAFAFEVRTDRLISQGVGLGDIMICEPPEILKPSDGRMVVFVSQENECLIGRVLDRNVVWSESGNFQSVPVKNLPIVGVALELRRSLCPGYAPENPRTDGRDNGADDTGL
jgi:hypothetical protein